MTAVRPKASRHRTALVRERLEIRGAVQGVGFRPFVYRLAADLGLRGWVCNAPTGATLEVEGSPASLKTFHARMRAELPPVARIDEVRAERRTATGAAGFEIRTSTTAGAAEALVLPDLATCDACLADVADPANRRYRYPFTNCTNCGPRFSIIEALPYDRAATTMRRFAMCPACQAEYDDPRDRRFHAQPNACPQCGPQVALWSTRGEVRAARDAALCAAAETVRGGKIVALKGLGGFQLLVDAQNENACRELRRRKRRAEKPFALMCASRAAVAELCETSDAERALLQSVAHPIVLLRRRRAADARLAHAVAPGLRHLGVMLPCTPLHHLLLEAIGGPVVCTSGNVADEPICIDEQEALERLNDIADVFLVHDRPIVRPMDDSVVRVVDGETVMLRAARGYAPISLPAPPECARSAALLAVGAHQKNTVALAVRRRIFVSQHVGDLDTPAALQHFARCVADLPKLYHATPTQIVHDDHPDYTSTFFARQQETPCTSVQHHHSHIASVMHEHGLEGPVLGVAWDGTGLGLDGTIWGGEFLEATRAGFTRVAHLRTFPLPGGEICAREPRRCALAVLHELGRRTDESALANAFTPIERNMLQQMLATGANCIRTSSAGRLFDAVAALLQVRWRCTTEGIAAMELEALAARAADSGAYPVAIREAGAGEPLIVDWAPLISELLADWGLGDERTAIAARFHRALVDAIVRIAQRVAREDVVLSGGCFQNAVLLSGATRALRASGFRVFWPRAVPPNDGGIALGQVAIAAARAKGGGACV